jgi:hypothetical protein
MDTLATIARQRALIATIADAIMTAAAGKSLRVAVGWSGTEETVFADQLTRALLARGLPCRCVQSRSNPTEPGGITAVPPGGCPMVAVITSGVTDGDEGETCRIDIRLDAPTRPARSGSFPPGPGPGGPDLGAVDDHRPDIVVDYVDPDGPTIRHLLSPA